MSQYFSFFVVLLYFYGYMTKASQLQKNFLGILIFTGLRFILGVFCVSIVSFSYLLFRCWVYLCLCWSVSFFFLVFFFSTKFVFYFYFYPAFFSLLLGVFGGVYGHLLILEGGILLYFICSIFHCCCCCVLFASR
jgi:hypothetical protein